MSSYATFENLKQHNATLHDSVRLGSGVELAAWSNKHDRITQQSDHHTLSLYIADGYECYQKTPQGWRNGGGPDHFCLMPKDSQFTWDVRSDLSFVHLYCTDQHLRHLAEQIWDRSPAAISLDARIFGRDEQITLLYRQFMLNCRWQDAANHLQLSSATTLLLTHVIRSYTQLAWQPPAVRGGLAPAVLRRVKEYIDVNLSRPLLLADLAEQAGLSEYHFARMFKQSTRFAPHQYVLHQRLERAERLLRDGNLSLQEIALTCGFSSASHFSHRFRAFYGQSPSSLR